MTEYTPTTEEVRLAHAESVTLHKMDEPHLTEANAEFDRWLEGVIAVAEQRGRHQAMHSEVYRQDMKASRTAGAVKALREAARSGQFIGPIADQLEHRAKQIGADDE